jgi:hypothetical protein
MDITGLGSAFDFGGKIIDKIIPDAAERDKAKLALLEMQQNGELAKLAAETDLAKGQLAINAEEAKSASVFVAGWRPGAGWVCVIGLAYTFLIQPILSWVSAVQGWPTPPPLDMGDLLTLLGGLLGLGGFRMAEKMKGVASK